MAESQSKKQRGDLDQITIRRRGGGGGESSFQRFYKRRRGQWGHSRGSINAALAIAPTTTTTTAPLATSNEGTTTTTSSSTSTMNISIGNQSIIGQQQQQMPKQQRHGRKRRRHRHSSFSGGGGGAGGGNNEKATSSYSLPPSVAALLAIPPKTPETRDDHRTLNSAGDNPANIEKMEISPPQQINNGIQQQPSTSQTPNGSSIVGTNNAGVGKKKKRPRRRRQRRNWKPYYKLTADERRELEEREEKRAERVRAKRFAHGQPVAPYNTTQFLLRDRELRNGGEPDCGDLDEIVRNIRHHTRSGSYESPGALGVSDNSDDNLSSDNSDYSYLEREFDNDWLDEQRQRLEAMTKDDLVKEFMDLQKQYESAQRDMRSKRLSFEEQITNLQRENQELRTSRINLIPPSSSTTITRENNKNEINIIVDQNQKSSTATATESASDSVDDFNYSSSSSASASTNNEPVVTVSVK